MNICRIDEMLRSEAACQETLSSIVCFFPKLHTAITTIISQSKAKLSRLPIVAKVDSIICVCYILLIPGTEWQFKIKIYIDVDLMRNNP